MQPDRSPGHGNDGLGGAYVGTDLFAYLPLEAAQRPSWRRLLARAAAPCDVFRRIQYRLVVWLDAFFEVSARGSTIGTEVWAGCVGFITMSYIMVVSPVLLNKVAPLNANEDDQLAFEALLTGVALSAATGSLLAGLLCNAPVGLAPGLRLNAYFTYGFVHTLGVPWAEAMSCCFVSGAIMLLLALLGVCDAAVGWVLSDHLKKAIAVAMGIFQAMIGFQLMGLVLTQQHAFADLQCRGDTVVTLTNMQCSQWGLALSISAFVIISGLLVTSRFHGALLAGIFTIAVGAWLFGVSHPPTRFWAAPRFDLVLQIDFSGWLASGDSFYKMAMGTSVMLVMALFDILGVQYGLYSIAGLLRHGSVPRCREMIASAAVGTMAGGLFGASPVVIANESSASIMEGARTGISAIVISLLFASSAFVTPLLCSIPDFAAAAPLVLVGVFMMEPCRSIAWDDLRVAIPSFVTILLVPYWIHNGIVAGIVMDALCGAAVTWFGRWTKVEGDMPPIHGPTLRFGTSSAAFRDKKLQAPHCFLSVGTGLKREEKVNRARQLLRDLGPPTTGMQASDTWDIALRQALEMYIVGSATQAARSPRVLPK